MASDAKGVVIRTPAEFLADRIGDLQRRGARIFVRGVNCAADAAAQRPKSRRSRRASTPTMEELAREGEIEVAVGKKLSATVETLMRLAGDPGEDARSVIARHLVEVISAAPSDSYGQRRALEKMFRAIGSARLS